MFPSSDHPVSFSLRKVAEGISCIAMDAEEIEPEDISNDTEEEDNVVLPVLNIKSSGNNGSLTFATIAPGIVADVHTIHLGPCMGIVSMLGQCAL